MELWDAYDRSGNKLNFSIKRGETIPQNVYHILSDTVVRHQDGTYLLMQRAWELRRWAGMFQVGAGGHVLKGETPIECAIRELKEESGIVCNDLEELYIAVVDEQQSIFYGYLCITDCPKDSICLQKGETIAYKWVSREEFIAYMDSDDCMDTQKTRLKEYVDSIRQISVSQLVENHRKQY